MNITQRILILGGGIGGVTAANLIRKKTPQSCRVIVVDRSLNHCFSPSFVWVMTGDRKPQNIVRPLNRLERKGIEFIHGNIDAIDPINKTATVRGETIQADTMVLALGADFVEDKIPGLREAGHNLYTLADVEKLPRFLSEFTGKRIIVLTASPVYKCPAAPYEAAMLVESYLSKHKKRQDVTLDMFAAEAAPMATAGANVSAALVAMLDKKAIQYHPSHQATSVDPSVKKISFSNGSTAPFDLLLYVPVHVAPKPVTAAHLINESGWIPVNRGTLKTQHDGVYAIGDLTFIPLKNGKSLPKAGVFAHRQAEVVASEIAREIVGKGKVVEFDGKGQCLVEIGDGRAISGKGDFFAEPSPVMTISGPSMKWHFAKVLFEKYWLSHCV